MRWWDHSALRPHLHAPHLKHHLCPEPRTAGTVGRGEVTENLVVFSVAIMPGQNLSSLGWQALYPFSRYNANVAG